MTLRVVLAVPDLFVREGVRRMLEGSVAEVVAACAAVDEAAEAIVRHRPDVLITAVGLQPGLRQEGLALANELRVTHPPVAVLVLDHTADPAHAQALFADGSDRRGYLVSDHFTETRQLLDAIVDVAGGGSVVDGGVVGSLFHRRSRAERSRLRRLSARERQVLSQLAAGRSNAAIARDLGLSKRSVEHHVTAIFTKLQLDDEIWVSRRVLAALAYLDDAEEESGRDPPEPVAPPRLLERW